jgi:hypothetical protein
MRGKYYIWTSGSSEKDYRVHFWVASDDSLMRNSVWAEQFKEDQIMGAVLPKSVFDELVVMRYAELQEERKVDQTAKRAMRKYTGNLGCESLCKKYGKPIALDKLEKRIIKTKQENS